MFFPSTKDPFTIFNVMFVVVVVFFFFNLLSFTLKLDFRKSF